MKYLFIDTETTGLAKNEKLSPMEIDNWPRLVSVAYILTDNKAIICENYHIIKPEGFIIPIEATKVHGITTAKAISEGKAISYVLSDLKQKLNLCDFVVGHNVNFDINVLNAEYFRQYKELPMHLKPSICTMKQSKDVCKLRSNKYPKLEELYFLLKGEKLLNNHNAMIDTKATMECFWILKETGLIDFGKNKEKIKIYPTRGNFEFASKHISLNDDIIKRAFALFALVCVLNERENMVYIPYFVKIPNQIKLIKRPKTITPSKYSEIFSSNINTDSEWLQSILKYYEQILENNNHILKRILTSLEKITKEDPIINEQIEDLIIEVKNKCSQFEIRPGTLLFFLIYKTKAKKEFIIQDSSCENFLKEIIEEINKSRIEQIKKEEEERRKILEQVSTDGLSIHSSGVEKANEKGCLVLYSTLFGLLSILLFL